jgi:hypothetical protein
MIHTLEKLTLRIVNIFTILLFFTTIGCVNNEVENLPALPAPRQHHEEPDVQQTGRQQEIGRHALPEPTIEEEAMPSGFTLSLDTRQEEINFSQPRELNLIPESKQPCTEEEIALGLQRLKIGLLKFIYSLPIAQLKEKTEEIIDLITAADPSSPLFLQHFMDLSKSQPTTNHVSCAASSSSAAAATESLAFRPFSGVKLGLTPNERMKLEYVEKLARIIQLKTELEKEQNALRSIAKMIDTDNPTLKVRIVSIAGTELTSIEISKAEYETFTFQGLLELAIRNNANNNLEFNKFRYIFDFNNNKWHAINRHNPEDEYAYSFLSLNTSSELLPDTPLNTIGQSDGDMYIQYVRSNWLDESQEFLKKNHPGSANHPNGCRVCPFADGLCWKGMACEFCHICSKPKKKSKHQRDVEKRRAERNAAVALNGPAIP